MAILGKSSKPKAGQNERKQPPFEAIKSGVNFKNSAFGGDANVLPCDLYRELTPKELKFTVYKYVPFLTSRNNLLDTCYAALMTSPIHSAIIKNKVNAVIGDGFKIEPTKSRFTENVTMPTNAQIDTLSEWMDYQNENGETLEDVFKKVTFDYEVYGNAFVEFVKTSSGSTKLFVQRVLPFQNVRIAKMEDGETEPTKVGISKYWIDDEINPVDIRVCSIYPLWSTDENGVERSVYHIKNYHPNFNYYGVPDYVAALIHCDNDYQIGKYNNSRFQNGFVPSAIMTFYGQLTPDEAGDLVESFEETFTGTGSNSKIFSYVLADKADAPDLKILDDRKDGAFMELSQITAQGIVAAHRYTMSLSGFATSGQLGTNQQIRTEAEIVYANVIRPDQNELLRWVNTSIKEWEMWTGQSCNCQLGIKNRSLISFVNDIPPSQVLTQDEQRAALDYPPLKPIENGKP